MAEIDYDKVCFVIMPFNKKTVEGKEVDFNFIYERVFKPAIESVDLPEGGKLEPHRTDYDYMSASIPHEMFLYIEYSRFALVDISGLNANVFYELGVRHRAHESGTAIFRQESGMPPFDISQIKAFPYEYEPETKVSKSIELIKQVLTESLKYNRLDSPVTAALRAQRTAESNPQQPNIEPLLIAAENALRIAAWTEALQKLSQALDASPNSAMVLMKRGLVYRDQGKFAEARADFERVINLSPKYAEAYREKGIAQNKIFMKELKAHHWDATQENIHKLEEDMSSGEQELRKAVELNPTDFDALSSLGGVLKRKGQMQEAYEAYDKAVGISQGNSYPLLNAVTIQAHIARKLEIEGRYKLLLRKAERSLQMQVEARFNPPWSMFDFAQVSLYLGNTEKFVQFVDEGILACTHKWQPQTLRETLDLLTSADITLPRLEEGIAKLKEAESLLD